MLHLFVRKSVLYYIYSYEKVCYTTFIRTKKCMISHLFVRISVVKIVKLFIFNKLCKKPVLDRAALARSEVEEAFAAAEGRSMVLGAFALLVFSFIVCQVLMRFRMSAVAATGSALVIWMLVAFGLKQAVIG